MQHNSSLAWGIVILLILFIFFGMGAGGFGCMSYGSYGFMGFGMLLFWIPLLIFLILGIFWFSQQLQHTKQRRK